MLLVVFIIAINISTVPYLFYYITSFSAFTIGLTIPVFYSLISISDTRSLLGLGVIAIMFIFVYVYARKINSTYIDLLYLRSENIRLIADLSKKREEAEKLAESKSKFLAAASHDIRQPIHAVALYTAVLESECDNPKLVPTISKIVESIGVLEGLFNALLDISKYDSGTIKPKNKTIAINKLFTQLNNEFSVQATAKNLRFELVNSNYYVYSDEILLGIVLRNLLANALKYTKTGKIGLSAELHHGKLRIVIKDTGIGIAKEYQSHIFTEFFQLQNPQRDRSKGLGLGLAIVDRLVKQLGLDLVLISEVNKGSCFIIDGLPITSKKAYSEFFNRKNDRLKGLVVVAIDDEKDILFGMEALLLKWGCSVVSGDSLESCQQILLSRNLIPDAVIADYRLGLCDGIDSIMQLRRQYNVNLPAMLVTGDTSNVVESRAKENNIAYIAKPVDIVKLNSYLINTTNASN